MHRRHLGGVNGSHRRGRTPPCEYRRDHKAARRDVKVWQYRKDVDAVSLQTCFLGTFAQSRCDAVSITRIDRPARECWLSRVGPHVVGPFDQQHIRTVRTFTEKDENGRPTWRICWRGDPRELLDTDGLCGVQQGLQPLGCCHGTETPRYSSTNDVRSL
jgi:hypothetical protein